MAEQQVVTPWEVSGNIDYTKLVKEFGTQQISEQLLARLKKHTKDIHPYLRRKIFFSHRDFDWILDEYEKGNPFYLYTGRGPSEQVHLGHITVWRFTQLLQNNFYLYTGRGPSGHTHIGHLVPWVFTKWLQEKFGCELYFQMTDDQKFFIIS